jgi:hypothetical protein
MEAQKRLTLDGNIVISVGLFGHAGDNEEWEGMDEDTLTQTKIMLDDMHKRKIDMADEIYVINVDGYIGDSTKSEIAYAQVQKKPVHYLDEEAAIKGGYVIDRHIAIEDLPITVRLCHILTWNKIMYLDQVENYSEEMLMKLRNMGQSTMVELKEICNKYGIHVYSHVDIEDDEYKIYFTPNHYEKIFRAGIKSKDDVINTDSAILAKKFGSNTVIFKKLERIKLIELKKGQQ